MVSSLEHSQVLPSTALCGNCGDVLSAGHCPPHWCVELTSSSQHMKSEKSLRSVEMPYSGKRAMGKTQYVFVIFKH